MSYRRDHPDFTVTVDGAFNDAGVWQIDVVLRFRDDLPAGRGDALVAEARLAAIRGIAQEGLRGRTLGSTSVLLQMDGDPEVLGHASLVNAIGAESVH